MVSKKKRKFRLPFLGIKDGQLAALPFGRQIEYLNRISDWRKTAKVHWVSQKNRSNRKAVTEAVEMLDAVQWFYECYDEPDYRDDTFELFYKTKEMLDAEKAVSKDEAAHPSTG